MDDFDLVGSRRPKSFRTAGRFNWLLSWLPIAYFKTLHARLDTRFEGFITPWLVSVCYGISMWLLGLGTVLLLIVNTVDRFGTAGGSFGRLFYKVFLTSPTHSKPEAEAVAMLGKSILYSIGVGIAETFIIVVAAILFGIGIRVSAEWTMLFFRAYDEMRQLNDTISVRAKRTRQ